MKERIHPTVSVLVTVYNREAFLAACLDSVLASTWQDFEVVVVDDGSTDKSCDIAVVYSARDPRIRFHRNEKNLGDYPNRIRAAELAEGKYLKYVDSDDLIYRHSLAIMVEAMEANPEAALGLSHSQPEDDEPYPWLLSPEQTWRKQFLGRGCFGCGPSGAIFRRDAFFEVGGFRNWGVLSDIDLWHRLSARSPVLLLAPGLVWWRRHDQQEFTKDDATTVYLEKGFAVTTQALTSPNCPLRDADARQALTRACQHHARTILAVALRQRKPIVAWRLFRDSGLGVGQLLGGLGRYR